jgi:hypothetical protein
VRLEIVSCKNISVDRQDNRPAANETMYCCPTRYAYGIE